MVSWVHSVIASFWLALFLYWLPLALCFFGYSVRTWKNYRKDITARSEAAARERENGSGYYSPTDTIGSLIGRALVTVVPAANLLAGVFDVGPEVFSSFIERISKIFDQPLVPKQGARK